jgi:methionyl aminopeptidase
MIIIKSDVDIAKMRRSGKMTAETFHYIADFVKPGISTRVIDDKIEAFIAQTGGRPAFKGLYGFPASACISVNEEVVHGIPDGRILQEGDIVSIDLGVEYDGFFGDSAYTFAVGEISAANEKLLQTTQRALYEGIQRAVADNRLGDISNAIEKEITPHNYGIVRDLVGHGIGAKLHEDPQIPNYGKAGLGPLLRKNMVFAIEPMVNAGTYRVKTKKDGWTVVTADGKMSAHFEHTVVVGDSEPEILTDNHLKRW